MKIWIWMSSLRTTVEWPGLNHPELHEFRDRRSFQFLLVGTQGLDGRALPRRQAAGDGLLEFFHQHRDAFGAAFAVADGELDRKSVV